MGIKHVKVVCATCFPDDACSEVRPTEWNDDHTIDGDVDFNGNDIFNTGNIELDSLTKCGCGDIVVNDNLLLCRGVCDIPTITGDRATNNVSDTCCANSLLNLDGIGLDSMCNTHTYTSIREKIITNTCGCEDGQIQLHISENGTLSNYITLDGNIKDVQFNRGINMKGNPIDDVCGYRATLTKTSSTSRMCTTTVSVDPILSIPLAGGAQQPIFVVFEGVIFLRTPICAGFKWQIHETSFCAGFNGRVTTGTLSGGTLTNTVANCTLVSICGTCCCICEAIAFHGFYDLQCAVCDIPNTMDFEWSQKFASAVATTVQKGSYITYTLSF